MPSVSIWPHSTSCLVFASKQTIVVIVGTGGYQCRPIGLAQTRTFSTARKSFGLSAAIMLWLTGSPWVPNDPNKYILYPWVFHLPSFAAIHSVPTFVPLHVPVLIGDVYEQLPTIKVVKLAPFAWECFFNCVCASIQAWESFCHKKTRWGTQTYWQHELKYTVCNHGNPGVSVSVCPAYTRTI